MLLGAWEILLVLVVALIVLGPDKLPEVARKLARMVGQARRIADDVRQNVEELWEEPPLRTKSECNLPPKADGQRHGDQHASGAIHCDGRGQQASQSASLPRSEKSQPPQIQDGVDGPAEKEDHDNYR